MYRFDLYKIITEFSFECDWKSLFITAGYNYLAVIMRT